MLFEGSERKQLEREMARAGRLPPGQSLTLKWPVLHEGSVPQFDPKTWDFRIYGMVEVPVRLTWEEFNRLPVKEVVADMHCVTRWNRLDVRWEGVPFIEVAKLARIAPDVRYVMVHADQGIRRIFPSRTCCVQRRYLR
ncbi:MAG: molybdopterin-dependent oxidoreductase [Candidatus Acidiferrales bacterium]|jgi:DMSO/TMAO reductase YedYZ molybdopterin-dependent catalytic subunit